MRRFLLLRARDITGVSGTGVVAEGCIFTDGATVVRWRGDTRTTAVHTDFASVERVHLHGGATVPLWCDTSYNAPMPCTVFRKAGPEPGETLPYAQLAGGHIEPTGATDIHGAPLFDGQRVRVIPGAELGDVGEINHVHVSPDGDVMAQVCGVTCSGIADFRIGEIEALETIEAARIRYKREGRVLS